MGKVDSNQRLHKGQQGELLQPEKKKTGSVEELGENKNNLATAGDLQIKKASMSEISVWKIPIKTE